MLSKNFIHFVFHLQDICHCCVFYAQRMSRRVEYQTGDNNELFSVSTEWCLAINNIDYIRQSLPAFIKVSVRMAKVDYVRSAMFNFAMKWKNT